MALHCYNSLVYDDVLDITWLLDANFLSTYLSALLGAADVNDGRLTWDLTKSLVRNINYKGFTDWRLASANLLNPPDNSFSYDGSTDEGYNNTRSEMGHMFYNNLGNLGFYDTNGDFAGTGNYGIQNTSFDNEVDGPNSFINTAAPWGRAYWLDEEYATNTDSNWSFNTGFGIQLNHPPNNSLCSWPVHDGNLLSDMSLDEIHTRIRGPAISGTEVSMDDTINSWYTTNNGIVDTSIKTPSDISIVDWY